MSNKRDPAKVLKELVALSQGPNGAGLSLDVLNILGAVCSVLVGRGLVDAAAIRAACETQILLAHENGQPARALAAEHFIDQIESAARGRREAVATVLSLDQVGRTKN